MNSALAAAGAGAVSGGLAGLTMGASVVAQAAGTTVGATLSGVATSSLAGGTISAAASVVDDISSGREISTTKAAVSFGIGTLAGGGTGALVTGAVAKGARAVTAKAAENIKAAAQYVGTQAGIIAEEIVTPVGDRVSSNIEKAPDAIREDLNRDQCCHAAPSVN